MKTRKITTEQFGITSDVMRNRSEAMAISCRQIGKSDEKEDNTPPLNSCDILEKDFSVLE